MKGTVPLKEIYKRAVDLPLLDGGLGDCLGLEKLYRVLLEKWGLIEKKPEYTLYMCEGVFYDTPYNGKAPILYDDYDYLYDRYLFDGSHTLYRELMDYAFEKSGLGRSESGLGIYNSYLFSDEYEDKEEYLLNSPYKIALDSVGYEGWERYLQAINGLSDLIMETVRDAFESEECLDLNLVIMESNVIGRFKESGLLKEFPEDPLIETSMKLVEKVADPFCNNCSWQGLKDGIWYNVSFFGITEPYSSRWYGYNCLYPEWVPAVFLLKENLSLLKKKYEGRVNI